MQKNRVSLLNYNKQQLKKLQSYPSKQMKIIKFTGDMKQNIQQLLVGMQCKCGLKKDFHQIISAYGQKIIKLRQQRGKYKQNLTQQRLQNQCLQQQITNLKSGLKNFDQSYFIIRKDSVPKSDYQRLIRQNNILVKKLEQINFTKIQMEQSFKNMQQQILRLNSQLDELRQINQKFDKKTSKNDSSDSYLLGDSQYQSYNEQIVLLHKQNEVLNLKIQKYDEIFKRFDLDQDQIIKVLNEYIQEMPSFGSKQQRELYRIGLKMNSNLWKKKIELQIKQLHQKKQMLKKIEQQLNEKKTKYFQ